jgi:hypothetical protein
MRVAISALALAAAVSLAPVAIGQIPARATKITVRAISGKTGKPLAGFKLELYGVGRQLYPQVGGNIHLFGKAKADASGTAVFEVAPPFPDGLFVGFGDPGAWVACSDRLDFFIDSVVRQGVVTCNRCDPKGKLRGKFKAKPGEIVVFIRKFTRWDYFKQEIL